MTITLLLLSMVTLDLLRHSAEQTLVDMLKLLFSRLPHLPSDHMSSDVTTDQVLKLPTNEGTCYCYHNY